MPSRKIWIDGVEGEYEFTVYKIGKSFTKRGGVYCFARETYRGNLIEIYFGRTGDLSTRTDLDNHHKGDCIKVEKPTHICVHFEGNNNNRISIETDILNNYLSTPCND